MYLTASSRCESDPNQARRWLERCCSVTAEDGATQWLWEYNAERPDMALGGITHYQKLTKFESPKSQEIRVHYICKNEYFLGGDQSGISEPIGFFTGDSGWRYVNFVPLRSSLRDFCQVT